MNIETIETVEPNLVNIRKLSVGERCFDKRENQVGIVISPAKPDYVMFRGQKGDRWLCRFDEACRLKLLQ